MSNKKHKNIKKTIRIIGIIMLICGIILTTIGMISLVKASNSFEWPELYWLCFIGFPLIAFGIGFIVISLQAEIARYTKNERVDVINEASKEISPAIENISESAKKGYSTGIIICAKCNSKNDSTNNFCYNCGSPLYKTCPKCGNKVKVNDAFCGQCGEKLDNSNEFEEK